MDGNDDDALDSSSMSVKVKEAFSFSAKAWYLAMRREKRCNF